MFSAKVYFLGKYRPLTVVADTLPGALDALGARIQPNAPSAVHARFADIVEAAQKPSPIRGYAFSCEHGTFGAGWSEGDTRWPTLDALTADFPPCPGIQY